MIVGIIPVRVGSLGRAFGSSAAFGFALDHSGVPRGLRAHSGSGELTWSRLDVAGFIVVSFRSLRRAYVAPSSLEFAWVHSGAYSSRRVHSSSRGFTRAYGSSGSFRVRVV